LREEALDRTMSRLWKRLWTCRKTDYRTNETCLCASHGHQWDIGDTHPRILNANTKWRSVFGFTLRPRYSWKYRKSIERAQKEPALSGDSQAVCQDALEK